MKFLSNSIVVNLVALVYFVFVTLWLPSEYPMPLANSGGALISVSVTPGMTAKGVAYSFMEAGLVRDPDALLGMMLHLGVNKRIKVGTYTLHAGSPWEVAQELKTAAPKPFKWTIIPGYTFAQLAARAGGEDAPARLSDALMNDALYPQEVRPLLADTPESRLAFLLPDTYSVPPGTEHLEALVRTASALWWKKIGQEAVFKASSAEDMLAAATLASLVEREVRHDDERPIAAGVFINRLSARMPLQSCASVIYAWSLEGEKKTSLTYADLEIASPYNTYKNRGLPPGPVGIPSLVSWKAALNPAHTDYMFFVLGKNGRHIFTRTYAEHLRAISAQK